MDRTELLMILIENTGMNLKAFSQKAGLPYSTLRSMLERGIGKASVDNVIKVCQTLGITVEELMEMAENDSLMPINHNKEFQSFTDIKSATEYLVKLPAMAAYGGYDIKKMTDAEIIEFANEILHQFEVVSHKYKK